MLRGASLQDSMYEFFQSGHGVTRASQIAAWRFALFWQIEFVLKVLELFDCCQGDPYMIANGTSLTCDNRKLGLCRLVILLVKWVVSSWYVAI